MKDSASSRRSSGRDIQPVGLLQKHACEKVSVASCRRMCTARERTGNSNNLYAATDASAKSVAIISFIILSFAAVTSTVLNYIFSLIANSLAAISVRFLGKMQDRKLLSRRHPNFCAWPFRSHGFSRRDNGQNRRGVQCRHCVDTLRLTNGVYQLLVCLPGRATGSSLGRPYSFPSHVCGWSGGNAQSYSGAMRTGEATASPCHNHGCHQRGGE